MSKEYGEYIFINRYREQIEGKTVESVCLNKEADDGLIIVFTDGTQLSFGFSGSEGSFEIKELL